MIDALSSRGIEILDEFISASLSSSDASCNDSGSGDVRRTLASSTHSLSLWLFEIRDSLARSTLVQHFMKTGAASVLPCSFGVCLCLPLCA